MGERSATVLGFIAVFFIDQSEISRLSGLGRVFCRYVFGLGVDSKFTVAGNRVEALVLNVVSILIEPFHRVRLYKSLLFNHQSMNDFWNEGSN